MKIKSRSPLWRDRGRDLEARVQARRLSRCVPRPVFAIAGSRDGWSLVSRAVSLSGGRGGLTERSAGVRSFESAARLAPFEGLFHACSGVALAPTLLAGAPARWSLTSRL